MSYIDNPASASSIGAITGGACVNLDGVCVFDGQIGTTLTFRGIKSESAALSAALDAVNKTVDLTLDADLDALAALAGTGFAARTGAGTWALRSLVAPAAGLTIANPAGVLGDPTFALANDLAALEGLAGTGIAVRSAADTWVQRSIAVTDTSSVDLTIANADGVAGNPTLSAVILPAGVDHGGLGGLGDDDHAQYTLRAGRTGATNDTTLSTTISGILAGSSAAGQGLKLYGSTNAAAGSIQLQPQVTDVTALSTAIFVGASVNADLSIDDAEVVTGLEIGSLLLSRSTWTITANAPDATLIGVYFDPNVRNPDGVARAFPQSTVFSSQPNFESRNAASTIGSYVGFIDLPIFSGVGTGTLTVTTGISFLAEMDLSGATTITNRAGFYYADQRFAGFGAQPTTLGLQVKDQTSSGAFTLAAAVRSEMSAGTNKWALYADGTAKSSLKGALRLGDNTAPTEILEVLGNALLSGASRTMTLSTTAASSGTLFGNSTTTGNLTIRANSADTSTGTITEDSPLSWWPSIPDFTAGSAQTKNVATFDATLVMSPTAAVAHALGMIRTAPTITSNPTGGGSSVITFFDVVPALTLGANVTLGVLVATGNVINTAAPSLGSAFLFYNGLVFESQTSGVRPYAPNSFVDASTVSYNVGAGSATVPDTRAFRDERLIRNVLASGTLTVTNLDSFDSAVNVTETAGTMNVTTRRGLRVRDVVISGTPQITNNIGVDIEALTQGSSINAGIRNAATTIWTPSGAQTISAAGNAILANATFVLVSNTTGGSITLTSAPTIADGQNGQYLIIISTGTQNVVIQDQGTLASSNLRLSAATQTLAPRDNIVLIYSSAVGDWIQIGFTNVI